MFCFFCVFLLLILLILTVIICRHYKVILLLLPSFFATSPTSLMTRSDVDGVIETKIDVGLFLVVLAVEDGDQHLLEVATAVVFDVGVEGLFVLEEESDLDALHIDL